MPPESKEAQKYEDFEGGEGSGTISGEFVPRACESMGVEGGQVMDMPGEPGRCIFPASKAHSEHGSRSTSSRTSSGF